MNMGMFPNFDDDWNGAPISIDFSKKAMRRFEKNRKELIEMGVKMICEEIIKDAKIINRRKNKK